MAEPKAKVWDRYNMLLGLYRDGRTKDKNLGWMQHTYSLVCTAMAGLRSVLHPSQTFVFGSAIAIQTKELMLYPLQTFAFGSDIMTQIKKHVLSP